MKTRINRCWHKRILNEGSVVCYGQTNLVYAILNNQVKVCYLASNNLLRMNEPFLFCSFLHPELHNEPFHVFPSLSPSANPGPHRRSGQSMWPWKCGCGHIGTSGSVCHTIDAPNESIKISKIENVRTGGRVATSLMHSTVSWLIEQKRPVGIPMRRLTTNWQ